MATYREIEGSSYGGTPVEYYHFYRGAQDWYYTSSRRIRLFNSARHLPLEITRGPIDLGGADQPGALTITLPTASNLGTIFQEGSLPTPISLTITRQQPAASDAPWIIFIGEVSNADIQGEIVSLQALPFTARLDLIIPQGLYQKEQCQWNTYDIYTCKVVKATYTFTGTISAIDGLNITVDDATAFDPGTGTQPNMFVQGILQKGERQGMIQAQDGDVISLLEVVPTLTVGDVVDLIAGDDRTVETCRTKFANAGRRFSFPHMPVLNPFYGQGLRA